MHHNKTKKYDIIIVGAGPSGCTCAFELRKENKKVLLVDKHSFPRHKACAGGITIKALQQLPIDIGHLVQHCSRKMIFRFDSCELNTENFTMQVKGEVQLIEPHVFDLIFYLIEHRDRLVSRDELCKKSLVWS